MKRAGFVSRGGVTSSPPRAVGSVRRTATTDITVDAAGTHLLLRGSGRDLLTGSLGTTELDAAEVEVRVALADRTVAGLTVSPTRWQSVLAPLVGQPAGSGFRKAFGRLAPDLAASGSALAQLLDDAPVCVLISGNLLRRMLGTRSFAGTNGHPPVDVCAGWRADGALAASVAADGAMPLILGPVVAALEDSSDATSWHTLAAQTPLSMRRARRLDVEPDGAGGSHVTVYFRDSRRLDDGAERAVHEYTVTAQIDVDGVLQGIQAVPHVLPAGECPVAAASAQRLVGRHISTVRAHVAGAFGGTSTCTHLNDTLRSLGDVAALLDSVSQTGRA